MFRISSMLQTALVSGSYKTAWNTRFGSPSMAGKVFDQRRIIYKHCQMIRKRDLFDRNDSRFCCDCRNFHTYALFHICNITMVFQVSVKEVRCVIAEHCVENIGSVFLSSFKIDFSVFKPVRIFLFPCIFPS